MKKMLSIAAAGLLTTLCTTATHGGVAAQTVDFSLEHQTVIQFPITVTGQHDWGTSESYFVLGDPTTSVTLDSNAGFGAFDNAIMIDLNDLQYEQGLYTTAMFSISGLADPVDLSSVGVFVPVLLLGDDRGGGAVEIGGTATSIVPGHFQVGWDPFAVMLNNALDHRVVIAWNSAGAVPAPGALALLGLAGVVGRRKRRRD